EGTEPAIGASELKVPLIFQVGNLVRNIDHTALLVLRMENFAPAIEIPIRVLIHMRSLPPRVAFEPEASSHTPVIAGTTLRGQSTSVVVTPRNFGDEALVPLVATISTNDNAARATPAQFH